VTYRSLLHLPDYSCKQILVFAGSHVMYICHQCSDWRARVVGHWLPRCTCMTAWFPTFKRVFSVCATLTHHMHLVHSG
jgi:uncharacterized membrane protein